MRTIAVALLGLSLLTLPCPQAVAREPWVGKPPYGRSLMTRQERKTYWKEFQALETDEERRAYWDAHVERMKQRVIERGVSEPVNQPNLAGVKGDISFWRPPYFQDIMTEEEQLAYRPTLDSISDRLERTRFVAQHIRKMYARGIARGVSVPSTFDFADVFETLGEQPPDAGEGPYRLKRAPDPEEAEPGVAEAEDEDDVESDGDSTDSEL